MYDDFDFYQMSSRLTAQYPNKGNDILYPTLGLCGKSGEVAEKVKKVIRDHGGIVSDKHIQDIKMELGDILWYVAQLCTELNLNMSEVAKANIDKLVDRMKRGKIKGEGDNR